VIARLALKSLLSRRFSACVCIAMIALSAAALLTVDTVYRGSQAAFSRSVQGIDLIAGAPTGDINLLLFSAFHVGSPSRELSWQTFSDWRNADATASAVPLMLGDSHRGFRVIGTDSALFDHIKRVNNAEVFTQGRPFSHVFDVTLGHEVARTLGYRIGDALTLSHGLGGHSFQHHEARTFKVTGILAPTGTPIDKTLQISVEGITAIHWSPAKLATLPQQPVLGTIAALKPSSISAFYLTLNNRARTFQVQRAINQNSTEPSQAILPGVAMTQLWSMLDWIEAALLGLGLLAALVAAIGVVSTLLGLLERRVAEFQLMATLGARRRFIYTLLGIETTVLVAVGLWLGALLTLALERSLLHFAQRQWGLYWPVEINGLSLAIAVTAVPLCSGLLLALVGAWRLSRGR
tara:strand:- start:3367 stop:4587 length:1221 start_codon:yes stop_codon:yes gene_type:complete